MIELSDGLRVFIFCILSIEIFNAVIVELNIGKQVLIYRRISVDIISSTIVELSNKIF